MKPHKIYRYELNQFVICVCVDSVNKNLEKEREVRKQHWEILANDWYMNIINCMNVFIYKWMIEGMNK